MRLPHEDGWRSTKLPIALSQPGAPRGIKLERFTGGWHLPGIGLEFPSGLTTSGLATNMGTSKVAVAAVDDFFHVVQWILCILLMRMYDSV